MLNKSPAVYSCILHVVPDANNSGWLLYIEQARGRYLFRLLSRLFAAQACPGAGAYPVGIVDVIKAHKCQSLIEWLEQSLSLLSVYSYAKQYGYSCTVRTIASEQYTTVEALQQPAGRPHLYIQLLTALQS